MLNLGVDLHARHGFNHLRSVSRTAVCPCSTKVLSVSPCSFNGCSNQILSLAINGSYVDSRYILCPAGIHEGESLAWALAVLPLPHVAAPAPVVDSGCILCPAGIHEGESLGIALAVRPLPHIVEYAGGRVFPRAEAEPP